MLQFAVWDRIKELKALSSIQISHMAKFLGNLILEKNLALSILKVSARTLTNFGVNKGTYLRVTCLPLTAIYIKKTIYILYTYY